MSTKTCVLTLIPVSHSHVSIYYSSIYLCVRFLRQQSEQFINYKKHFLLAVQCLFSPVFLKMRENSTSLSFHRSINLPSISFPSIVSTKGRNVYYTSENEYSDRWFVLRFLSFHFSFWYKIEEKSSFLFALFWKSRGNPFIIPVLSPLYYTNFPLTNIHKKRLKRIRGREERERKEGRMKLSLENRNDSSRWWFPLALSSSLLCSFVVSYTQIYQMFFTNPSSRYQNGSHHSQRGRNERWQW